VSNPEKAQIFEQGPLRLVLTPREDGWTQEYSVGGNDGWRTVLTGYRRGDAGADESVVLAVNGSVSAVPMRFLSEEKGGAGVQIRLEGRLGRHRVSTTITMGGSPPGVHVRHIFDPGGPVDLAYLLFSYCFQPGFEERKGRAPEFAWAPNLRPGDDHVISEHVFRSPAVVVCNAGATAALVPDLEAMRRPGGMPTALDYDVADPAGAPVIRFGFMESRSVPHTYYRHTPSMVRKLCGGPLEIAYHLLLDLSGEISPQRRVASFHWERHAKRYVDDVRPQVVPLERYARQGYEWLFERSGLYREFEFGGETCGGAMAIGYAGDGPPRIAGRRGVRGLLRRGSLMSRLQIRVVLPLANRPKMADLFERAVRRGLLPVVPQFLFQGWYNNMRTACGAAWFARRWGDEILLERAHRMAALCRSAPEQGGAFAAACFQAGDEVIWKPGTRGFSYDYEQYSTVDASVTGFWMLHWHNRISNDPALLEKARRYGDLLLGIQQDSGAIPSWFTFRGGRAVASPTLASSAQTAAGARFLASLAGATGREDYLEAARRAADFLIREVIPGGRWFDFETFFSCSAKPLDMVCPHTGLAPANTLSMFWTADALGALYERTGHAEYLERGRDTLDLLNLYQQVWDAPFLAFHTFGGYGVMNTDGEWSDARQALFVPVLLDYYRFTGKAEYFERAVAALRASFALMILPENEAVARANMAGIAPRNVGSTFENYGHFGYDHRVPAILEPDWGTGSACAAAALVLADYGQVHVDLDRERAFGIDGCTVKSLSIEGGIIDLDVAVGVEGLDALHITFRGDRIAGRGLRVNGREAGRADGSWAREGVRVPVA